MSLVLFIIGDNSMQPAPIKKKKKYVMVQRNNNPPASSSSQTPSSSPTAALSRSRFDYSFDQILNHIFAKLLPDSRFIIRLSERLIFGRELELDRLLQTLDENVRFYTCFLLELEDDCEKEDIQYELQEHYRAKLFGERLVEKCIQEFFLGTCYELQCTAFLKMFQRDRNPRLFVRMSCSHVEEFLQKISDKAKPVKSQSVSDRVAPRGNRRECRTQATSLTVESQHFDPKNWKDFLHKSEKLDKRDIEILENKNPYGYVETYTIRLLCEEEHEEDSKRKIEAFNYYFRHQNFIAMPLRDSKRKEQLLKQYGNFKKNWLQVKIVRGFRSPKWDDKTLLYKLRCGQVPSKKSSFACEPIEAFQLIGLLPKVREHLALLQHEINTVPMDDLKVQLYLEPEGDLRDALKNNRKAESYLQGFIREYAAKFGDFCELKAVKFPVRGIRVDLIVRSGKEEEFGRSVRVQLQTGMLREVAVRKFELDIPVDLEISERLQKEEVLVIKSEDRTVFFLSSNAGLPSALTAIQTAQLDFQSLSQEIIECRGRARLVHYQTIIQSVREGKEEDYSQIFIADPSTNDKTNYRICLIGPRKKNSLFTKTVRQRIADFQATLGTYSQEISTEMADFLGEDTVLQELLVKKWKISLLVDPAAKTEAVLWVEPMVIGKKLTIIQGNSLSRVPFGSTVYFIGRKQLQSFQQSFLQGLKTKSKKAHPNQFIKDTDPYRKLDLFYKEASNPIELLSKALDEQKQDNFCLILPQIEKQKFLRQLLTVLTSHFNYERKKYNITLIDPNPASDIKTIVGLPDQSTLACQKQIILEWSCEGSPYSQSGNDKINEALANGSQMCLLTTADLIRGSKRPARTHQCNLTTKTLRCIRTKEETPLAEVNGGMGFMFRGGFIPLGPEEQNLLRYYIRAKSSSSFYLALAYYSVDLTSLMQSNIFTGKSRAIKKKEREGSAKVEEYGGKVRASYDVTVPQVVFNFQAEDGRHLDKAILEVGNYIQSKRIRQSIPLKPLGSMFRKQLQQLITAKAAENNLLCSYDAGLHQATAISLQQREIDRFRSVIQREVEYLLSLERMASNNALQKELTLIFPQTWQGQNLQIQKFTVPANSQEFLSVQTVFAVRPILLLERIQNKFLFRKYQEELQHLTFLNGGQRPRELQLFHGTGETDPELIWGDREGGFNINYSSANNMLGMGVYFAKSAQYSHSYRHKSPKGSSSMLFCSVIVGESQQMVMTRNNAAIMDTGMKGNGLRYESVCGKHEICDIYVIYKDKRAYPHYLIHYQI